MADVCFETWLQRAARLHPERVAVSAPDGVLTYGQLLGICGSLGHDLRDGLPLRSEGERVAIDVPPGAAFVAALHAIWASGFVAVPIDARWPAAVRTERLRGCLAVIREQDVSPAIANAMPVGDASIWAAEVSAGMHGVLQSVRAAFRAHGQPGPPERTVPAGAADRVDDRPRLGASDVAVVLWTSGSTGPGTEVRLTFGNLLWNAIGSAAALGQPADERWLSAMPVAHVGGLTVFTRSAIGATTAVVRPRFDTAEQVALLMAGEATITSVVPTMLRRMLDAGLEHPPNLRLVLLGGAPITPDLTARAAAAGVPIASTYGMTEACSQVFTAGAPLFCTTVALRSEVQPGGSADLADEILVKGPTLGLGVAGADGWFATGDRGARAGDGTLSVVGRLAETIISGGENVAPTEVEAHLAALPGIVDAAVLGVADPEWGERIEARVVVAAGSTFDADAARAALREQLPPFAVPKAITVVDALPRTPTGKLRRRDLR